MGERERSSVFSQKGQGKMSLNNGKRRADMSQLQQNLYDKLTHAHLFSKEPEKQKVVEKGHKKSHQLLSCLCSKDSVSHTKRFLYKGPNSSVASKVQQEGKFLFLNLSYRAAEST